MIKKAPILLLILFLLVACNSTPTALPPTAIVPPIDTPPPTFDRTALLQQLTDNVILPAHAQFVAQTAVLQTASQTFATEPNAITLTTLQTAWQEAATLWKTIHLFELGPIKDSRLHNRIHQPPPRTAFINKAITEETETLNSNYIDSIGSTSVGLAAMEYLIFEPINGNEALLSQFTRADHSQRRLDYLVALSNNLNQQAIILDAAWRDYAPSFIEADLDAGALQGSINMLVNEMVSELEFTVQTQIGKPLGKSSGGAVRPDLVEAVYAETSLDLVTANILSFQEAFNGGDGVGLDDYLDFLEATYEGQPLSIAINDQIDTIMAAHSNIDTSLQQAVSDNPDQVEPLYQAVRQLIVLVKVDMANHLGITITFNDNDGD